jgi:thiol-disulfide isomerase/thioredoxin
MKKILTLVAAVMMTVNVFAQYENNAIQVGQAAPELAFNTPEGKVMKLSEINKKRIVLIDFWASWCGPCRQSNPGLVKMYDEYSKKKYKTAKKGFVVLSVSLDKNKDAWTKAIAADKLNWEYHISDLQGWQSAASAAYGVTYIPQCFLVDENGKIIGKYMRAEQAIEDLNKLVKE